MSTLLSQKEVRESADRLAASLTAALDQRTVFSWMGSVRSTQDVGQSAFWLKPPEKIDRAVLHLIKSHIVTSESRSPGAGEICALVGSSAVRLVQRWIRSGIGYAESRERLNHAINEISGSTITKRRLRLEDVEEILSDVPSDITARIMSEIVSLPLGSSVSVRKGSQERTWVGVKSGLSLRVWRDSRFSCAREVVNPKVLLFDGTIETVGQIHRLLEESSERGVSFLIICRGHAEDVGNTVSINTLRGTVKVSLAVSRLDDLTVGTLDDLSAYLGARVISSQSGESISTSLKDAAEVSGKFWFDGEFIRSNASPSNELSSHISALRRDTERGDQSVVDFLNSRILGLTSSRIEVILGLETYRAVPNAVEIIDTRMRALSASLHRGVSDSFDPPATLNSELRDLVLSVVPARVVCAGSSVTGIVEGLKMAREILSVGCAVIA